MDPWMKSVEEKIREAMENGEFDDLAGKGKPLELEDDSHVPAELRMTYRIMKRSGIPPEEVLLAKNLAALKAKLLEDTGLTETEREEIRKKLKWLEPEVRMKFERFRKLYSGL